MSHRGKRVLETVLSLPPVERAAPVKQIVESLDSLPHAQAESLWAGQAADAPLTRGVRLCRYLPPIAWLACVVATAGGLVEAEFTALCGPVVFLLGLAIFVCGITAGNYPTLMLGAGYCGICLLLLGLVALFRWGPAQAQTPFFVIGTAYTTFAAWPTVKASKTLVQSKAWQCRHCGYALFGLSEPRCPECGAPFDPAKLATLKAPVGEDAEAG